MRVFIALMLFFSTLFSKDILSKEKEKLFNFQKEIAEKEAKKQKTKWISPLYINASFSKNSPVGGVGTKIRDFYISWRQDLFRSGGIFYAIEYAKALKNSNLLNIDLKRASLIKRAYILKAQIERDNLKLEKLNLLLENRKIDVLIVKEKFKAGNADIARLNETVLREDETREDIVTLKNILKGEVFELKKLIGDRASLEMKYEDIPLLSKEEYIKNSIEILIKRSEIDAKREALSVKKASYLPKVSFDGRFGYQNISSFSKEDGRDYSFGFNVKMPIDYNEKRDIEISRLNYLQSKLLKEDREKELSLEYDKRLNSIKSYEEKIELAKKREKLYKELYDFTKEQVKAGMKTDWDLKSLSNSLKIQKLEEKIQKYNILIEKFSLYFDTVK